jgi:predicted secreted protein
MLRILINGFFIYMIIWWTVLFCILPLRTTTFADAGVEAPPGCDPGAPMDPKLKWKAWTTTWVSAIVCAIGFAIYALHIIHLPDIPIR